MNLWKTFVHCPLLIVLLVACNTSLPEGIESQSYHWSVYEYTGDSLVATNGLKRLSEGTASSPIVADDSLHEKCLVEASYEIKVRNKGTFQLLADAVLGSLALDGKKILAMGPSAPMDRTSVQTLEPGVHTITYQYLGGSKRKPFKAQIEPWNLLVDKKQLSTAHSYYFGWEEDHPKAISLMGGMLYPRRPQMINWDDHSWEHSKQPWHPDSDKPVAFLIAVDGSEPYYPDEQEQNKLQWTLAEGYLPVPVSEWSHQGIQVRILHLGRRLKNNTVNAVYTRVEIQNTDHNSHSVKLIVNGEKVSERVFSVDGLQIDHSNKHQLNHTVSLKENGAMVFDFISPANGKSTREELLAEGGFDVQYTQFRKEHDLRLTRLTIPVALPDRRLVDLWKSSMAAMWNATVATPTDLEQRGSGGNVHGFYQYDRVFDHDVPDMVNQYILEGNHEMAIRMLKGDTYNGLSEGLLKKEQYLDAIPKYLNSMALYLQVSGDIRFFKRDIKEKIHRCESALEMMFENQPHGLIKKGGTLDNGSNQLVVDNFAALHGMTSYRYLCSRWGDKEGVDRVDKKIKQLTDSLNSALTRSMKDQGVNWYNACFSFDPQTNLLSGPGNWFGTTLMMSTFPWNAWLKGYDHGGEWLDHYDASIEKWIDQNRLIGNPEGSFGAWWGAKYGAAYNAGMALELLRSDKHRTKVATAVEWLLENQTAPHIWGESFHAKADGQLWTQPEVDYETWALGFIRQALLQICISIHANGDVILGRGIPDHWLPNGKPIQWRKVRLNDGRVADIGFVRRKDTIVIETTNGTNGQWIVNVPMMAGNIRSAMAEGGNVLSIDQKAGRVIVEGSARRIEVELRGVDRGRK